MILRGRGAHSDPAKACRASPTSSPSLDGTREIMIDDDPVRADTILRVDVARTVDVAALLRLLPKSLRVSLCSSECLAIQ